MNVLNAIIVHVADSQIILAKKQNQLGIFKVLN